MPVNAKSRTKLTTTAVPTPGSENASRKAATSIGERRRFDGARFSGGRLSGRPKTTHTKFTRLRPAATKQGTAPARPWMVISASGPPRLGPRMKPRPNPMPMRPMPLARSSGPVTSAM
jgi:hypothetical protein